MHVPDLPLMARYALAATTQLALLGPRERLATGELATRTAIPRPILAKVLRMLARAGLVDGLKGHHGGYRLARPPEAIRIGEVLAALNENGNGAGRACALGVRSCNPDSPCALHEHWAAAIGPIESFLAKTRLSDVVGRRDADPE